MLKVKAYKSIKLEKTQIYWTKRITMQLDVDEMTEDYRWEVQEEGVLPMINFWYYDVEKEKYHWISIPVQFVISIEEA